MIATLFPDAEPISALDKTNLRTKKRDCKAPFDKLF
jgi:hypothetical protein